MSASLVAECFGKGTSLYAVLGVEKGASEAQLRRAYYKKALAWHPDKDASPAATKKFQALGFIHALLADKARRAQYDRAGRLDDVDDDGGAGAGGDAGASAWYEYWRGFFAPVTEAAVRDFEASYRGGAEERADVLRAYAAHGADLDGVLEEVLCSRAEDAPRFVKIIQAAVRAGEAKRLKAFASRYGDGEEGEEEEEEEEGEGEDEGAAGSGAAAAASSSSSSSSSSSRAAEAKGGAKAAPRARAMPTARGAAEAQKAQRAREAGAADEAAEADEMLRELRASFLKAKGGGGGAGGGGGEPSLTDLLMHNREKRAGGFDDLLAKYGGKPKGGGGGAKKMLRDASAAGSAAGAAGAEEDSSMEASPGKKAKKGKGGKS